MTAYFPRCTALGKSILHIGVFSNPGLWEEWAPRNAPLFGMLESESKIGILPNVRADAGILLTKKQRKVYAARAFFLRRRKPGILLEMTEGMAWRLINTHTEESIRDQMKRFVGNGELGVHYEPETVRSHRYEKFIGAIDTALQ